MTYTSITAIRELTVNAASYMMIIITPFVYASVNDFTLAYAKIVL